MLLPLRCASLMDVRKPVSVSLGWTGLCMNEHGQRNEALLCTAMHGRALTFKREPGANGFWTAAPNCRGQQHRHSLYFHSGYRHCCNCCCIAPIASSQLVLQSRWRMPATGSKTCKEATAHSARLLSHSRAGPSGRAESPADDWQFELLSTAGGSGVSSRLANLHLAHGVQSTKHAGAHLHRWAQQRPEDARRFVAGAFAGAAAVDAWELRVHLFDSLSSCQRTHMAYVTVGISQIPCTRLQAGSSRTLPVASIEESSCCCESWSQGRSPRQRRRPWRRFGSA